MESTLISTKHALVAFADPARHLRWIYLRRVSVARRSLHLRSSDSDLA